MIAIGLLFLRILCDCFKSRRRLEAEILILRHQLNVLRQRAPRRGLQLRWVDRALLIWLYRRYPRILDAITIVRDPRLWWAGIGGVLSPLGDGDPVRPAAGRGLPKKCGT